MAGGEAPEALFRLTSGKRTLAQVRSASVVLGTHSGADLVLNDPIAAGRHARIVHAQGGFVIEDLGGATGTFVNGLAVEGPTALADGARIVLGVTRLVVSLGEDQGRPLLSAAAEEGRFHFKFRDPEAFRSDPDEWARSEVRFGRVPLVASLAWGACLLGLCLAAFALATRAGNRFLSPGPPDGSHAALFADPHSGMDCASCHTGRGTNSVGVVGCASCHADLLVARHPFHAAPVDAPHGRLEEGACTLCHSGHGGRSRGSSLALARARPDALDCGRCHEGTPVPGGRALAAPTPARRPYGFDPFSHAAHLAALPGLECGACHLPADAGTGLAPVSHATCLACHDGSGAESALRERLARADLLWQPRWHGSAPAPPGQGCLACHERGHAGALAARTLARPAEVLAHWIPRGHADAFAQRRCAECHRTADALAGDGERRRSPFDHGQHLASLVPRPGRAEADLAGCLACHADVAASAALGESRSLPPLAACATCHVDAAGRGTLLAFEEAGPVLERSRPPFSHAQHQGVEGGCYACHAFEADPSGLATSARTLPGAQSCVACHAGHSNLGGGSCQGCHPAADPATVALFEGRRPERLGAGFSFPHHTPGHAELMRGGEGCTACHPRAALEASERVEDLPLAEGTADLCRTCHAREGRPFHWF